MPTESLTDENLRARTRELISAAQKLSADLLLQTEALNSAIDSFNTKYVAPLREGLGPDDDDA